MELAPGVAAAPMVKLDDSYYKLVDQLDGLVSVYPSLKAAKAITVKGPVRFDAPVEVKGECTFANGGAEPKALAAGVYEDASVDV